MLTQIKLDNDAQVNLPILGVTPKNSLLIQKVTGLNPPDRSLFIGDYSQDGGIYQGRRVGSRNVVFTINLNPNPALGETVSKLRESLYKSFIDPQVDGDYLKIVLYDEAGNERYLVGYCEKFESEIFDVETMCQISMICPDPYLRDNVDTIHIQEPNGWTSFPYKYQGSAETGFVVRVYVTKATDKITLNNNDKLMRLETPSIYGIGDVIIINTIRGQRSISLTTSSAMPTTPTEFTLDVAYPIGSLVFYGAGVWKAVDNILNTGALPYMAPGNNNEYWEYVSTPIASHLSPTSQWLELHSVNNTMKIYEADNQDSLVANIKYLKYTSAYWGI